MTSPIPPGRTEPTWSNELRVALELVAGLCMLAACSAEAMRHWLLPIGGALALAVAASLAWRELRGRMDRDDAMTLLAGLVGGALFVAVQWQLHRIAPPAAWHAAALNFVYGFGWLSATCLAARWLRRRAARASA